MERPGKLLPLLSTGVAVCMLAAVTIGYAYSAMPVARTHPLNVVLYVLSYAALLTVFAPFVRDTWRSTSRMQHLAQSFDAFMREHGAEMKEIAAESRWEKTAPLVVTREELRYLWTPRAYWRHPLGRQACRAAGAMLIGFGFLCIESALRHDTRGVLTWGAVALITPLMITLFGIMSYRERAVQDHTWQRLMAERPWLFDTPPEE